MSLPAGHRAVKAVPGAAAPPVPRRGRPGAAAGRVPHLRCRWSL